MVSRRGFGRGHGRGKNWSSSSSSSSYDRKRSPTSSPSSSPPSASLLDDSSTFVLADDDRYANPRSFPFGVKQQCWEKAEKIKGRDPDRWRCDALGNTVFRKLVGCPGCLCHDYDHILPYSKGGRSTLENCQVLQATVNRSKGNKTEVSKADLVQKSAYCRVSGRDMDLLELSAYGNVRRGPDSGGCNIQ
ncbi:HNH endonuclease [Rhynchospora pubera]|uniref:HNH endonuclease n=1 Tax=Rhynchospora pubera TaxID=906938 RepID=A0AAV8FSG5_9POAL|nr:HNH endonuclease [Rhynchospora pubera]